jgi:hypothetical protein
MQAPTTVFRIGDNVKLKYPFKLLGYSIEDGMATIEFKIPVETSRVTHNSALGPLPKKDDFEMVEVKVPLACPCFKVGHPPHETFVHPTDRDYNPHEPNTGKKWVLQWKDESKSIVFSPTTGREYILSINKDYVHSGEFAIIEYNSGKHGATYRLQCGYLSEANVLKRLIGFKGTMFLPESIRGKLDDIYRITHYRTQNAVGKSENILNVNKFLLKRVNAGNLGVTFGINVHNSYVYVYLPFQLIEHDPKQGVES